MAAARDLCQCGRPKAEAIFTSMRVRDPGHVDGTHWLRRVFYRCVCGQEWTDVQPAVDPDDPVTADEIITVHERLSAFEGPLPDLLREED
jgi:hypothetical protein